MKKQFFAILMALCLVIPAAVFAQQQDQPAQQAQDQAQQAQDQAQQAQEQVQDQAQQAQEQVQEGAEQAQEQVQDQAQQAQDQAQQAQEQAQEAMPPAAGAEQQAAPAQAANLQPPQFGASQLRDMSLTDENGTEVGKVQDAFLTADGRISHLVASLTGQAAQGAQAMPQAAPGTEQQGAAADQQAQAPTQPEAAPGMEQGETAQAPAAEAPAAEPAPETAQAPAAEAPAAEPAPETAQAAEPAQPAAEQPMDQAAQGQVAAQGGQLYLIPAEDVTFQQDHLVLSAAAGMNYQTYTSPQDARANGAVDRNSVLASRLMDYELVSDQSQPIGQIEEVVVNLDSKAVDYVAVNFSGILGVADRLFAVPYDSVFYNLSSATVTIPNVDQQALESAQGFTRDNWPTEADPNWSQIQAGAQGAAQPAEQAPAAEQPAAEQPAAEPAQPEAGAEQPAPDASAPPADSAPSGTMSPEPAPETPPAETPPPADSGAAQ